MQQSTESEEKESHITTFGHKLIHSQQTITSRRNHIDVGISPKTIASTKTFFCFRVSTLDFLGVLLWNVRRHPANFAGPFMVWGSLRRAWTTTWNLRSSWDWTERLAPNMERVSETSSNFSWREWSCRIEKRSMRRHVVESVCNERTIHRWAEAEWKGEPSICFPNIERALDPLLV
jgi:hypothetical protein